MFKHKEFQRDIKNDKILIARKDGSNIMQIGKNEKALKGLAKTFEKQGWEVNIF